MTPGSPETITWFKELMSGYAQATVRPMFGHVAAMVNGRMAVGTYGEDITLRLGEAEAAEAVRELGAVPFEPMPGRAMTGYWLVPGSARDDEPRLREWLERALEFTAGLPPKKK